MTRRRLASAVILGSVFAAGMWLTGCGGSDSSGAGGGPQLSGLEQEARDAAMAEIQKRWKKDADGWTTARVSGSAYAPDRLLRQVHEIVVRGVGSDDLSAADKQNGFEWTGAVKFQKTTAREAGDPGIAFEAMSSLGAGLMRQRGQWTQWVDWEPEDIQVQKAKGKWQVNTDTWLLRGSMPTAADYANAGVK
jgi:hypothetical protein